MFKQIYETIPSSAWTLVAHMMPSLEKVQAMLATAASSM